MNFKLTEEQYNFLSQAQKREKISKRYKKITVLLMLHQEYSISAIELALGLDDNTIRRYHKKYVDKGYDRFVSDNYLRYRGKLTNEQEQELSEHLSNNLYADAKNIAEYVKQNYNLVYSESGMTKALHRLGFVYKKTKSIPSKADEIAQLDFLEETLTEILEQAERGECVVYYADGCHPTHNTNAGKGWIKRGEEFAIDCNSGRDRVNINAAINGLKPEHVVYELTDSVNAQSTKRLCQKLIKKHRKNTIYLICDNARYYKNRLLKDWIANQRIEIIYLPPYSPNLNLIERLWRFLRKRIINCTYYENYEQFKTAVEIFMSNTQDWKKELRSLMTLNFQTCNGESFYAASN